MNIWLLPIEPLEERYSAQWLRWFPRELTALGHNVVTLGGYTFSDKIERGQFLDVLGTHHYKSTQLALFTQQLNHGMVRDGDVVLLLDAWNPAVVSLAYMRDLGPVKFKIVGAMHAGSYDRHDMLGQSAAVRTWARPFETSLIEALDAVLVATEFHREMICSTVSRAWSARGKVHVTGFPLYDEEWAHHSVPWPSRDRVVVFPHRLAPEKQPEHFEALKRIYRERYPHDNVSWIRTKDACPTKQDFYRLLGEARVAFSSALQETWGIAMLEAASLGCYPVCPDRLSYPELYGTDWLYDDLHAAARRVRDALDRLDEYGGTSRTTGLRSSGHLAISRMASVMEAL